MSDIVFRTRYYERTVKDGRERLRFLPFYSVTVANCGKLFEPVDCMSSKGPQNPIRGWKEFHQIQEFPGQARMFQCEFRNEAQDLQLHKFQSWDWPEG